MKQDKKKPLKRRFVSLNSRIGEISHSKKLVIKLILLPLVIIGIFYCGYITYTKLLSIYNTQSIVNNESDQIIIKATPHFSEANIRESFGIRHGSNLATIDFMAKRDQILKKRPLLSNILINRNLARKSVTIIAEERKPIARINYKKNNYGRESWLVADSNGVVFDYSLNDSQMLPIIKEARPSAEKGEKISGKALWGLKLVELCTSKDLANIYVSDIDVSNDTYLIAKTRDYNKIKLLWSYINEHGAHNAHNLRDALEKIRDIINADLKIGHYQTFIVTGKNRVTVSPIDKEYTR